MIAKEALEDAVKDINEGLYAIGAVSYTHLIFGKIDTDVMQSAKTYLIITAVSFSGLAIYNSCAAIFRSMNCLLYTSRCV